MRLLFIVLLFSVGVFASDNWNNNYDKAIELAKAENKRIYMFIVSDDCRWCTKFENTTLKNKQVIKRLNDNYVLLHLVRERDTIPDGFKTSPVPRHYFLTPNGKTIFPVVGYRTVNDFNDFLDNVDERYKRIKNETSTNR
ncbi:MAG: DUF255 domain-containing protein [Campylobacterota bacterium]|nr:DUF255 domain-containing protein [Campylobacterota bacterium]